MRSLNGRPETCQGAGATTAGPARFEEGEAMKSPMRRQAGTAGALLLLALADAGCAREAANEPAANGSVTAFVNVTVVPMDRDGTFEGQTVLVRDGRIERVGPAGDVSVPAGARRIEGAGRYLMPGLAEMHGHLPGGQAPPGLAENILFLYVANGITVVRGMQGHPSQFELRARVERGEIAGPHLYLGSPSMTGESVKTPDDAERLVREYHDAGYDLLKVHEGLRPEVYDRIATVANALGLPFGGHVTDHVGLLHALDAGQATVDHLDNYVEALVPDVPRGDQAPGLRGADTLMGRVDESRLPQIVDATREAGTAVVPTMVLWEDGIYATRPSREVLADRPETRYMPRATVDQWARAVDGQLETANVEARRRLAALRRRILLALHEGGVTILLGTDSPQIFSVPGFSTHREVRLYGEAGMRPYDILAAGTRKAAEHLDPAARFGVVAEGFRADLILLEANPLEDVRNLERRVGVMVEGRWISGPEIQDRLAQIATAYATP
jgi:imidazolonepropionase-like amidohydrolase